MIGHKLHGRTASSPCGTSGTVSVSLALIYGLSVITAALAHKGVLIVIVVKLQRLLLELRPLGRRHTQLASVSNRGHGECELALLIVALELSTISESDPFELVRLATLQFDIEHVASIFLALDREVSLGSVGALN